jgi:hypothetical protein
MLRDAGHEVYDFRNPVPGDHGFSWSWVDPNWENWTREEYVEALQHPIAVDGFSKDFGAMLWSDTCVCLLPSGVSAALEAGWCKGAGRLLVVHVCGIREPDLMYKIADRITLTDGDLLAALETD